MLNRRGFLTHTCGLGVASATLGSTALSMGLARSASAASLDGYKALVCVLLAGGNDSFNMLVPNDSDQYDEYRGIRSDLALNSSDLKPLSGTVADGRSFALHPNLPAVHEMYENQELAFIANVGTLMEPIDAEAVEAGAGRVPIGLFSHSDQIAQWQTAVSYSRASTYGWGGRLADLIDPDPVNGLSMNVSLAGTNLFQSGRRVTPYSVYNEGDGAPGIWGPPRWWESGVNPWEVVSQLLEVEHNNLLRREYSRRLRGAIDNQRTFVEAIRTAPELKAEFSGHYFSKALKQIARVIGARRTFGQTRQTFFLQVGGWDHHDEVLNNQATMFPWVDEGLRSFRDALIELGEFDNVTTFTISDFARTLTSNGRGSDHGWGGHQLVMGGAVRGGNIFGTYPMLSKNSPLDVGRGVYVPTTAVEQYFSDLALWFGVAPFDLEEVLPNVRRFYSPESQDVPLGLMS